MQWIKKQGYKKGGVGVKQLEGRGVVCCITRRGLKCNQPLNNKTFFLEILFLISD